MTQLTEVRPVQPLDLLSITPAFTSDTSIMASGDTIATAVIEFTNAAVRAGGSGVVEAMVVVDGDLQSKAGELWLFSDTVTPAAANAAHSISDADAAKCVGVIAFGTAYFASALNSIAVVTGASNRLPYITGPTTSLFGILVTRSTPTYTAAGLKVSLIVSRNK